MSAPTPPGEGAPVRVRFAPSPTGYLHVGSARTALFNWLYARHFGGTLVLRVEDTDEDRSTDENTRAILDGMRWLGLEWDEGPDVGGPYGPYLQSERRPSHDAAVERLIASDAAYYCFCTKEELEARRKEQQARKEPPRYDRRCAMLDREEQLERVSRGEPAAIRLRVPSEGSVSWIDLVHGEVSFPATALDDFIIKRSVGGPVYNLAVVVDDIEMRITHVLRGDDHISNTPKQIVLYHALSEERPRFGHMPLILGPDRTKLSKRHGDTSVESYRAAGFLPDAFVNFLALLGWSYDGVQEIFAREELVRKFTPERMSDTPAVFDVTKLEWMNGEYLRALPVAERARLVRPVLDEAGLRVPDDAYLQRVIALVGDRLKLTRHILTYADYAFAETVTYDPEAYRKTLAKDEAREGIREVLPAIEGAPEFTAAVLEERARAVIVAAGRKTGDVLQPVRVALTGRLVSPGIFEVMEVLGRERTLARLRAALARETAAS